MRPPSASARSLASGLLILGACRGPEPEPPGDAGPTPAVGMDTSAAAGDEAASPVFVRLSGRLTPQPVLDPVMEVGGPGGAPADSPEGARVRGWDDAGAELFDEAADVAESADLGRGARVFDAVVSFAGPARRLARVEVRVDGVDPLVRSAAVGASAFGRLVQAEDAVRARRRDDGTVHVTWNEGDFGALLIRETAEGQVIAVGRGGEAFVTTRADALAVTVSGGVRSARVRVPVR